MSCGERVRRGGMRGGGGGCGGVDVEGVSHSYRLSGSTKGRQGEYPNSSK